MVAEDLRRAVTAAPIGKLRELAGALWKAFGAGMISDDEAQAIAEAIEARKAIPAAAAAPRRRVGSRPRSPEAMERRRRQAASGWLPPRLASRFTLAEMAVLAVVAAEVARRGLCRLTIGHVAAVAGVGRSTVKAALREARALGLLSIEEWRITAWRSAPNTIRILSSEWHVWLRMRDRRRMASTPRDAESEFSSKRGGVKASTTTNTHNYQRADQEPPPREWPSDKRAGFSRSVGQGRVVAGGRKPERASRPY